MSSRLIWHGKKVMTSFKQQARQNVLDAALLVEKLVKESMKKGGTTESGETVIKEGTKRVRLDSVSGKRAGKIGSFRSKGEERDKAGNISRPGEVPRVQTGTLKRAVTHEVHKVLPISRVGTANTGYAPFLEFGTMHMSPRPFMRPALHRAALAIQALWMRPLSGRFIKK